MLTDQPLHSRFCRFMGTCLGLFICSGYLWWHWPAAHGYIVNPFAVFLCVTSFACDVAYPIMLWRVRKTERVLPDGRIVMGAARARGIRESPPRGTDKNRDGPGPPRQLEYPGIKRR